MRRVATFCIAAIIGLVIDIGACHSAGGFGYSNVDHDYTVPVRTGFRDPMPHITSPSNYPINTIKG